MRDSDPVVAHAPDLSVADSAARILAAFDGVPDLTFVRGHGNVGDDLIHAGTRQLLRGTPYREVSVARVEEIGRGHTALLSGSGAWCGTYHAMPDYLHRVEGLYERVVVLPSSFDPSIDVVRRTLGQTRAKVFARERVSFDLIRNLCDADLAHDTALYYDYRPYRRPGSGTLLAYRDDGESARRTTLPIGNDDVSMTCKSLDEWLWTIARHVVVKTDRAHVTIAAAMLGKDVEYGTSNYHKVPAIVDFSLVGLRVRRMNGAPSGARDPKPVVKAHNPASDFRERRDTDRRSHMDWLRTLRAARSEIESIVPPGGAFIFVDDNQWGREPVADGRRQIPFMEKDGEFWGAPPDDATAVAELERLRAAGAGFIVFTWMAFWWLEHYRGLREHLMSRHREIFNNERLRVFDLRA